MCYLELNLKSMRRKCVPDRSSAESDQGRGRELKKNVGTKWGLIELRQEKGLASKTYHLQETLDSISTQPLRKKKLKFYKYLRCSC